MTIDRAIIELLQADDDVAALVAARVYADLAPSDSPLPLLEVSVAAEDPGSDLAGNDDTAVAQVAVDCIAADVAEARTLFAAVKAALVNQSGDWSGLTVQHCVRTGRLDNAPLPTWLKGKAFNKRLLLEIFYDEP
jgi:hypothetical protein